MTARPSGRDRRPGADRGAVLVHVTIALLGLMAVTTFVIDYGVFWLSRRQAQNAADAAALGAAVAIAYDDTYPFDASATGVGKQTAALLAQRNSVFGDAATVDLATDVTFPLCPDGTYSCVRVDVVRSAATGNALPVFFGELAGRTGQDVRAMATAQAAPANASDCLKPWALPDRWAETAPPFTGTSTFDVGDTYSAPNNELPGTGYTMADLYGERLELTLSPTPGPVSASAFVPYETTGATCQVGPCYEPLITACTGVPSGIGDGFAATTSTLGATLNAAAALVSFDPTADWDPATQKVVGSCARTPSCPSQAYSPRIIALPLVNPAALVGGDISVTNILGLFIDEVTATHIVGYVVPMPGLVADAKPKVSPASAFLKSIRLVR